MTTPELWTYLSDGPISAWPNYGDWEEDDDEWVVGIATNGMDGRPYSVREGACPASWIEIATVRRRNLAISLAAHLNALPRAFATKPMPPEPAA